jgi:hypothetical protein
MQVATNAPFCSPRIAERFQEEVEAFRVAAHDSKAANEVIRLLMSTESDKSYATGSRNKCVRKLAEDVEASIGFSANLMFRTPGALHNSLQTLMDAYMDAMDGIYYHKTPQQLAV